MAQSPQFALVKTCQKCLDLPGSASYLVFKSRRMRRKPIDYDALLKEFISDFFPDFIAFANPALYAAIDWEKGYVFLEQELINALRGKFKIKGKSKRTDKLVKVVLKAGADHYVYVHGEFQHKLEPDFALRMYHYRALIGLRYGIESITAIAVFTGAKPSPHHLQYSSHVFDTRLEYHFKSIVAVQLDEQMLIDSMHNPFAVAMLAAQYAYRSRNNPTLRLALKTKLFNLLRSRDDINLDRSVKLFIFVRDFVHLPKKQENEFQQTQISLVFPNEEEMIITQGTKDFALGLYERVFGYNPAQLLAEEQKKNEAKLAKERQQAEVERLQLLEALQHEAKEREKIEKERMQLLNATIFNLHHIAKMNVVDIALIVNLEPETVEVIISNQSEE